MRRWFASVALQLAVSSTAVALALAAGAVFIVAMGKDPIEVYTKLIEGSVGQGYGLGQVLYKATSLVFVGVAVALSFRAGLFNIGAEGQIYLGGFAGALAGLYIYPSPWVCAAAAALGGALAAVVPALLKALRGTHEVIVTIMMNFIVIYGVNYFTGRIQEPETVHTRGLADSARLATYKETFEGSALNSSLWVALAMAAFATYLLWRTRTGYEMRAAGLARGAAEAGGVRMRWTIAWTLLLSGAIAGLGSINFVLGNKGYFEKEFSAGVGFMGIAVALLGRNHPIAVIPAALLFAILSEGAVAIGRIVPGEIVDILQAITILFLLVGTVLLDRAIAAWQKRRQQEASRV